MGIRFVIAGESQCTVFAEISMIADYLSQNLPNFCCERIEKSVLEWEAWLFKVNQKNKWHHLTSPLIWKELLMKGSKPCYIGGAPEFLEYCYSYYEFDTFLASEKFIGLSENIVQYQQKIKHESRELKEREDNNEVVDESPKTSFIVCISGACNPLTMHLISGLLDMAVGEKSVSKIYLHDFITSKESKDFMEYVERECSYVDTNYAGKVVKYVNKMGLALTHTDLLLVLNHVSFHENMSIGDWLLANKKIMTKLSYRINASASRKMYILFPNLGPACYNATILSQLINFKKSHVVVATSDLGLEITSTAAEIAQVPLRYMFCPPVWGFVGINHLVDIRTTVHKYNSFEPYNRYIKVKNSSLMIGSLTPELRTMEYLMYFDESLWKKVTENKKRSATKTGKEEKKEGINKVLAVLDIAKLWLFDRSPDHIVSLGINCNGSFGLTFKGKFSQPARFINGKWKPAADYLLPKDPQMNINYLQEMAEFTKTLQAGDLPKIVPYYPCSCKKKNYKKKGVW